MKCRHLQNIIPELVCGEVDERTAQLAQEHIRECRTCAAEYAAYERAMCALAQPREAVEVPPALDRLILPEPVRKPGIGWMRPTFATAAMAAILAGLMLMPRAPEQAPRQKPVVRERIEQVAPKITDQPERIAKADAVPEKAENRDVALYGDIPVRANPAPTKSDTSRGRGDMSRDKAVEARTLKAVPPRGERTRDMTVADSVDTQRSLGYPVRGTDSSAGVGDATASAVTPDESPAASPGRPAVEPEGSVVVVTCAIEDEPVASVPPADEGEWSWYDTFAAGRLARTVGDSTMPTTSTSDVVEVETSDDTNGCVTYYSKTLDDRGREQVIEITRCGPPT